MDIYEQHQQAFRHVAAYVVTDTTGDLAARVCFKYAASGLRTTCYLHIMGTQMVKAYAGGGGYDKASAAASYASAKVKGGDMVNDQPRWDRAVSILKSLSPDDGYSWDRRLTDAGFNVLQAV